MQGAQRFFTEQMPGAVTDRPALHDALEFARSGDTLIVWKLDRIARSMKQLIETVETLWVRGIGFRSLTEALDTTTAQGRLVFHMFGALAEFERSLIRERTQAGLAAARRAGRTGGRPPKLTDDDIEAAKAMLANPDIAVTQIAQRRRLSGDALSLHPRRANREYPGRLTMAALPQRSDAPRGFTAWRGRRLSAESRCSAPPGAAASPYAPVREHKDGETAALPVTRQLSVIRLAKRGSPRVWTMTQRVREITTIAVHRGSCRRSLGA
jgi:DNA invertase Pin-like site-specific DNA recombinase